MVPNLFESLLLCDCFIKLTYIIMFYCLCTLGVVDSEDIPLNLSRELLQDSALIRYTSRELLVYSATNLGFALQKYPKYEM